jgi:hypothetical protein
MEHQRSENEDAVKISFDLTNTGWEWKEESMWALPVRSTDIFKLDNIPLLAYGISQGDIFQAELSKEGVFYFKSVIERGGHSTIRIHFKMEPVDLSIVKKYLDRVNQLGCSYEGNGSTLYALDIPPESNLSEVVDFLKEVEELGVWEYEEGYIHQTS